MVQTIRVRLFLLTAAVMLTFAAAMTAQQAPAAPAATQPDSRSALVMGQVLDADTGAPIAGATVRAILRPATATATPPASAAPFAMAAPVVQITDEQGRFLFHGLQKGVAILSAAAPGYMNPVGATGRGAGPSRPVQIGDAERLFDQKIWLVRFATISGAVMDDAGEPAVGFPVRAMKRAAPGAPPSRDSFDAVTDDRGMYRIRQLPPGDYVVVSPQTQMTMPVSTGDDLVSGLTGGAGGAMSGVMGELMASAGPQALGGLSGIRVGNVLWSAGMPLGGEGLIAGMGGSPHPPGPAPAGSGRLMAFQTTYFPAATTAAQAATITLRSGDNRGGVDFQLRPVITSRITGTVTGPSGPVRNVSVRLSAVGGEEDAIDVASAVTAADGSFTMLGVPAGNYMAKVEKRATFDVREALARVPEMAESLGAMQAFLPQGSKESLSGEAPIGVGADDVNGVAILMAPGAHFVGRVEFHGVGPKPTPQIMQQLTVTVFGTNGQFLGGVTDKVSATGEFKTAGYAPGKYTVTVSPAPIAAWMVKSIAVGARDVTHDAMDLKATDTTDVVITFTDQISNLTGTVKAPAAGGFEGVSVVYVPADYRKWYASGGSVRRSPIVLPTAAGTFSIARIPPGDYLIAAVDNGVLAATATADFYERLAQAATRVTVNEGEKKSVALDIVKVVR